MAAAHAPWRDIAVLALHAAAVDEDRSAALDEGVPW